MSSYETKFWTHIFIILHVYFNVFGLNDDEDVHLHKDNRQRTNDFGPITGHNIPRIRDDSAQDTSAIIVGPDNIMVDVHNMEISDMKDDNKVSEIQFGAVPEKRDRAEELDVSHNALRVETLKGEDVHDNSGEENIKLLLEEKYKFKNDETSTRYKITNEERAFPVFPEQTDDHQMAWAFRSYAVRRIVGGMETSISMYPYNVAIARNGKHWCGGSVIDEQWVLTAGHCLESAVDGDKKKLVPFIIRAGSSFHNRGGYQARVNKVFFPKSYVPGSADFDFSLLRLDRPMPIGRNIAVLNLPSKDYVMKEEDILIVTGWGSTDESGYGHIPDRLRFVPVPLMRLDKCQKSYRFFITPRMLCAGYATGGKDACNHDSGGPAVRDGVLLGIVSFGGKQCGDPRSPGVYSRVSEITDWVEKTITENEASAIPELKEKIQKARLRDRELQKFKARVEDKKNKIKTWLRETLKSPVFIELAKKKLGQAGFNIARKNSRRFDSNFTLPLDERTMDEVNLKNQINERILEAEEGDNNESEKLLSTLALQEVMRNRNSEENLDIYSKSSEILRIYDDNSDQDVSVETLVAYVTE